MTELTVIEGEGKSEDGLKYHDLLETAYDVLIDALNQIEEMGVRFDFERVNGKNIFVLLYDLPPEKDRKQVLKVIVPLDMPAEDTTP